MFGFLLGATIAVGCTDTGDDRVRGPDLTSAGGKADGDSADVCGYLTRIDHDAGSHYSMTVEDVPEAHASAPTLVLDREAVLGAAEIIEGAPTSAGAFSWQTPAHGPAYWVCASGALAQNKLEGVSLMRLWKDGEPLGEWAPDKPDGPVVDACGTLHTIEIDDRTFSYAAYFQDPATNPYVVWPAAAVRAIARLATNASTAPATLSWESPTADYWLCVSGRYGVAPNFEDVRLLRMWKNGVDVGSWMPE